MTQLEIWQELTRIAFIGSDRAFLEKPLMEELIVQQVDLDQDITGILLESTALYRVGRKAGFPLLKIPFSVNAAPAQEKVRYISSAVFRFLKSILHKNTLAIQLEFIEVIKSKKLFIPPEFLPELLDHPAISFEFKINLPFITDKKGHWLLQQNPDWQYLIGIKDLEVWKNAAKDARQIMLFQLRKHYPDQAGILLSSTWNEMTVSEKKQALNLWETGLSEKDIPYLEKWWYSKDKHLTQQISWLLLQIPESRFSAAFTEKIISSLEMESTETGEEKLVWTDPLEELKTSFFKNEDTGIEIAYQQLIGDRIQKPLILVSPQVWALKFNKSPEELLIILEAMPIEKFIEAGVNTLILQIAEAAVHFKESNWINSLLSFFWEKALQNTAFKHEIFLVLFSAADIETQHLFVQLLLDKAANQSTPFTTKMINGLITTSYAWKSTVVLAILKGLSQNNDFGLNFYEMEALLKSIALKSPDNMIESILDALEKGPMAYGKYTTNINTVTPLLRWRYQMHEMLKN